MVRVVVPSMLAAEADGRQRFDVDANTLGDALHALPAADLVLDERGELRRRIDARDQLRSAQDMFTSMGAEAFAARAGRELLATGETARKRTDETRDDLTAQEMQIAQLARDGLSNAEIGARLFISPRTVEYHLHKCSSRWESAAASTWTACYLRLTPATAIRDPPQRRPRGTRSPGESSRGSVISPRVGA